MSHEFITFEIGDRRLGIDIMAIREIRAWSPATPIPNAPSHVRGVVNLRGVVLPVLDLSQRLGWGATEPTGRHVIIVVRVGEQLQGIIVDAVSDIVTVGPDQLQPVPDVGQTRAAAFLDGIATIDGRLIMILGLDRITEQAGLAEAA
jgi:purine-binding chemotaxis protein CheW